MSNASLIFNPLKQLWGAYERQLERRPVLTQMTTSAVLWCSGDVIAQRLEHWEKQMQHEKKRADAAAAGSTKAVKGAHPSSAEVSSSGASSSDDSPQLEIDWRRAVMTGLFGSTFVGPVGHFWYINLDKWCARVFPGGGAKFIAAKVRSGLMRGRTAVAKTAWTLHASNWYTSIAWAHSSGRSSMGVACQQRI
jgi:protein Mpv17